MTKIEQAEGYQVALLVPHPGRIAVLVTDDDPSETLASSSASTRTILPPQPRLPTLRMNSAEPSLPEILAAVDVVDTSTAAALRLVMTSATGAEDGEDGELGTTFLVEFEAAPTDPPTGLTWQDLDASVIARLEPATSRAAVASWAHERAEGWSSLRPQWSHPGWFARASSWIVDQMAADRLPVVGAPRQHQLWGISVVLRAPSADGNLFFKCSAEAFRHEAVATQALAGMMPELVP